MADFCAFTTWESVSVERGPFGKENTFADLWMFGEGSLVETAATVTTLDEAVR